MSKKLLIISYTFPPSNNIGGRRWVKFCKYLLKNNLDVKVLTSKYNEGDGWLDELNLMKNKIDYLSFNYPRYLGIKPITFFQKISYRISLAYSKIITDKNYYDKSVHGKSQLLSKIRHYITNGYNNIVVSVAPFHLATHVSSIIDEYPNVNFIVDFRDPWVENKTSYGYYSLTKKRQHKEQISEKMVIEKFNYVVTVSNTITKNLRTKYPKSDANFLTIPNGFDPEDYVNLKNKICINSEIRLVFSGTFYNGAIKYLNLLSKWLFEIKLSNENLYNLINIDFYGSIDIENKIFENHENVIFHGFQKIEFVNNKIFESDACLLFLTDDINYSFSSKFCDYIAMKKPIIVFSNNGLTAKYVISNKIGNSLSVDSDFNDFIFILNSITKPGNYYNAYDSNDFNLSNLTLDYLKIIK